MTVKHLHFVESDELVDWNALEEALRSYDCAVIFAGSEGSTSVYNISSHATLVYSKSPAARDLVLVGSEEGVGVVERDILNPNYTSRFNIDRTGVSTLHERLILAGHNHEDDEHWPERQPLTLFSWSERPYTLDKIQKDKK